VPELAELRKQPVVLVVAGAAATTTRTRAGWRSRSWNSTPTGSTSGRWTRSRHPRDSRYLLDNLPRLAQRLDRTPTNSCHALRWRAPARPAVGDIVEIISPTGKLQDAVEVTDAIKPGVVSLPHG